jgi:hypothetical protein
LYLDNVSNQRDHSCTPQAMLAVRALTVNFG